MMVEEQKRKPSIERIRAAAEQKRIMDQARIRRAITSLAAVRPKAGDVGIELEIEGDNLPRSIPFISPENAYGWEIHRDGSLRGENAEYVTGGPIFIAEVEPMVKALWNEFEAKESVLKLSNRCSTHVHINVGTLNFATITSILALWGIIEDLAVEWCGEHRVSNLFCLRSSDTQVPLEQWEGMLEGQRQDWGRGLKYTSLNVLPVFDRGSVEFRAMRGADNPELVVNWVNFLWAIRETARVKYYNPGLLAQDVSANGVLAVFQNIIEEHPAAAPVWVAILRNAGGLETAAGLESISRRLREGFLNIQRLLFCVNWFDFDLQVNKQGVELSEYAKEMIEIRRADFANRQEEGAANGIAFNAFEDAEEPDEDDDEDEEWLQQLEHANAVQALAANRVHLAAAPAEWALPVDAPAALQPLDDF